MVTYNYDLKYKIIQICIHLLDDEVLATIVSILERLGWNSKELLKSHVT